MGILSILTSPFVLSLLVTAFLTFPLPLGLNYTILKNFPSNGLVLIAVAIFMMTFLLGAGICYNTSANECERYRKMVCFKQGLKQGLYSVLIYFIVFMFPFFKSGFTDIAGDTLLWNSIGEGFILGMCNIAITISNYFVSKIEGCKLSSQEAEAAFEKIESNLNSRVEEEQPETVKITA